VDRAAGVEDRAQRDHALPLVNDVIGTESRAPGEERE